VAAAVWILGPVAAQAESSRAKPVTGDSIRLIDGNSDLRATSGGKRTTSAPTVYRLCVDGLEFVVFKDGAEIDSLQALDRSAQPKACY
jgi:hypothetical protein